MASEMLYPVMPVFLKHIGFSVLLIGILEGIAEVVAGLGKPYFGQWSDSTGKRLPFVQLGYALSAISKPLLAVSSWPVWIFFARTTDRMGKGIRTAARDALLSDEATPQTRATVFGYHRSMDTLGAVAGPTLALVYLYFYPHQFIPLFLLAFIPGVAAVWCTLLIKPKTLVVRQPALKTPVFGFMQYWRRSPAAYKRLIIGLVFFALFNSSDVFLLLQLREKGFSETSVIALYIFYNLAYALLAFPLGKLADRIGTQKVFLSGLFAFALVYIAFATGKHTAVFIAALALYGAYAAATDGVAKAWISNLVSPAETGTAIGTFSGLQSIAAFAASSLAGLLWYRYGGLAALLCPAIAALLTIIYLGRSRIPE